MVNRDRVAKRAKEHDLAPTFSLLLDLLATNRDDLFHTPEELAEAEVIPADLPLVLQLDEWHHPNVYGETKPSQSEVFRQLAEVLATGNPAAYKPTEKPNNRDWKRWIDK